MPLNLQVDEALNAAAQPVSDEGGASSPLALSLNTVEVGAPKAPATQQVFGDLQLENGSGTVDGPKLGLRSRGPGTQHYVLRATNDHDPAGGRAFIIRNEGQNRDDFILDAQGNASLAGDLRLQKDGELGSPKLGLRSLGAGTQHYSLRATNNADTAGGRRFVIRNEDRNRDEVIIDDSGNVTVAGDILMAGADCAEDFAVEEATLEPGTVMVIGSEERLRQCANAYDKRVAGVISGAADRGPAIVLGRGRQGGGCVPLALNGKVFCKVDAGYAPIEVGDLLTTSPSPGHAMRASDPVRSFGAVLGKALRPWTGGRGLIPVLIALQ